MGFDVSGDAEALTEAEAERYLPKVRDFIQRVGIAMDLAITHSNKSKAESDIWLFEEKELDVLATIYLKRARKIGWMAEAARQIQHIEDVGEAKDVAEIVGKRLVATGMFYASNGVGIWVK